MQTIKGYSVGVYIVTPEDAKRYLQMNTRNRKIDSNGKKRIEQFKRMLTDGEFILSSDAIAISADGILLNGQHRLWAIVESGIAAPLIIITGLPDETKNVIDQGKGRSPQAIIQINGIPYSHLASGINAFHNYKDGHLTTHSSGGALKEPTIYLLKEYYKDPDFWLMIFRIAEDYGVKKATVIPMFYAPTIVGIAAYLIKCKGYSEDIVRTFFSQLNSSKEARHSAIELLRTRLLNDKLSKSKLTSAEKMKLTIKAWNAYVTGKELKQLKTIDNEIEFI